MAATDDNVSLAEDAAVTFDVRSNDLYPNSFSILAVSGINGSGVAIGSPGAVASGQVTLNVDGRFTFTPTANFNGTTSFNYQDGVGLTYQFFDGVFNHIADIPTSGGIQGVARDFNVGALAQSLTGSTDTFGIRYTGLLNVTTGGTYTFYTASDDGSGLYVDGTLVVNNDFFQGVTERAGTIALTAGQHALEIRYFQGGGGTGLSTNIQGPDTSNIKTTLLSGLDYQFFDGVFNHIADIPTSGGIQGVTHDFNVGALAQSLTGSTDTFGVRYTGLLNITTGGTYTFYTSSDDGSGLYVWAAAGLVDSGLSEHHVVLELHGTFVAEGGVPSALIVEAFDVVEDVGFGFVAGTIGAA